MLRAAVFCYCFLIFVTSARCFIGQFLYKVTSPKCCNHDEVLSVIGKPYNLIPYSCIPDTNRTTQILSGEVLAEFPWNLTDATSCVDVVVDEPNEIREVIQIDASNLNISLVQLNYFPKCCPIFSSYDTFEHKCVSFDNSSTQNVSGFVDEIIRPHLENGLFLIKPGVSECKTVVIDYELPYFDETSFNKHKDWFVENTKLNVDYGSYCIDKVHNSENYVTRVCHPNYDVCKKSIHDLKGIKCVRKCCQDGWMFKGSPKCRPDFEHGLDFNNDAKILNPNDSFGIIEGENCRKYLVPMDWEYQLDDFGNIKLHLEENRNTLSPFDSNVYCFEHVNLGMKQGRKLFMCFPQLVSNHDFEISRISLTLSCIFLIFTLAGYGFLPEMQNLHGKTLMCHCASLLVAFSALAVLQFYPTIQESRTCRGVGYFIMYTFLAAFMWSNIMCFDIWWTFGSMRVQGIIYKQQELRRFLWYCAYAWSIPAIITGLTFVIQHFAEYMPAAMDPFIPTLGGYSCFFEEQTNTTAFLTWFILPIAVISCCNIVLFIKTITYCYRVKNEIAKMKDSHLSKKERKKILSADTERLKVVAKLFLIMGISWIFEVISVLTIPVVSTGPTKIIEIIFDTVNCLQGVFIFCIFILKAKFLRALKKAFGFKEKLRKSSQSTTAVTHSTYVSPKHKV